MDTKRLAEIKERADKATPGPWRNKHYAGFYEVGTSRPFVITAEGYDAQFIEHARQDVSELITQVERLQEINEGLCDMYNELSVERRRQSSEIARLRKALDSIQRDASLLYEYSASKNDRIARIAREALQNGDD